MDSTEIHDFPPTTDQVFYDYKLDKRLKKSSDCAVYECHHVSDPSHQYVAKIGIKTEAKKLDNEFNCYNKLKDFDGVPRLVFYKRWVETREVWVEIDWTLLVMEKLCSKFAKTTSSFAKYTMSLDELVPMAVQQISLLEGLHSRGLIHKGVKPDNFVVSEDGSKVYLIDFNKSKPFCHSNGNHFEFQKDDKRPKGLPLFHSLNYHNGIRCSRRDDMESLGYCWLYLLRGELPWSHVRREGKHWANYVRQIGQMKNSLSVEELCSDLPQNSSKTFAEYLNICRKMSFSEKPNYEEMRRLIARSLNDCNNNNTQEMNNF